MDEQRVQAYVELIEQLLGCPQGQEVEVLQARADLVDAELLEVMEQYADRMESQGNANTGWLRNCAGWLAKALGMAGEKPMGDASVDAEGFLVQSMQLIAWTQEQTQISEFLHTNLERLDQDLLLILPEVFEKSIHQNDAVLVAATFMNFGNSVSQLPVGNRLLNLELSIASYQLALQVRTHDAFPEDWAMTQNNLATAYYSRIQGDRADNIELAIESYKMALEVRTQEMYPQEWAATMTNLANAYSNRIREGRAANIELAIEYHKIALEVYTREKFPGDWAGLQHNLANSYLKRIEGKRADNIEQAIEYCEMALEIYTQTAFSENSAMTQSSLANAYKARILGED